MSPPGQVLAPPGQRFPSLELAARLSEAADRLDGATDVEQFMAALSIHRRAWEELRVCADGLGHPLTPQVVRFCLNAANRTRFCLDDREIEALIAFNRLASAAIASLRDGAEAV